MSFTSFINNHRLLTAVVLGGLFYLLGQIVALEPDWLLPESNEGEISVSGKGEVVAQPDVAVVSFGVETGPLPSTEVALSTLTERMNRVIAVIREEGVAEEDIKTQNLSLRPEYDFTEGERALRGFTANQSVEVKIRQLEKVGGIVSATTAQGLNQLGGIQFLIDDPVALQQQAEEKAIEQARARAQEIAQKLNVELGPLVSYQTNSSSPEMVRLQRAETAVLLEDTSDGSPPDVPSGSQDIVSIVTVTYRIE